MGARTTNVQAGTSVGIRMSVTSHKFVTVAKSRKEVRDVSQNEEDIDQAQGSVQIVRNL